MFVVGDTFTQAEVIHVCAPELQRLYSLVPIFRREFARALC